MSGTTLENSPLNAPQLDEEGLLISNFHGQDKRQLQTGCPLLNNTQYFSTSNSTTTTFKIFCGFDYPNNDLNMVYTPTLVGCLDTCVAWNQAQQLRCVAVGFRRDSPGQGGYQCWIKGIAAGFTPVAGVDCASVVDVQTQTTSSTAVATSTTVPTTTFKVTHLRCSGIDFRLPILQQLQSLIRLPLHWYLSRFPLRIPHPWPLHRARLLRLSPR